MSGLPKALQDLAKAVSASTQSAEKEASDSEKRQKTSSALQRRFMADLEELARVTAVLNDTQRTATQRSEERAKRAELAQKRVEARNSRAAKENGVRERQNSEKQANWLNLIGAIGGKGLQGLVDNFVKAGTQTDKDVSAIAAARYEEKVASIDEAREDAIAEADARQKTKTTAIAATYQKGLSKRVSAEGAEAASVAKAAATLAEFEKAEAAYAAAQAERDRIDREGRARIQELEAGAASGQKPQGADAAAGSPRAVGATAVPGQGVVLDVSGRPVPSIAQMAAIEEAKKEHTEAYSAAEAEVSKKEISPEARSAAEVARSVMAGGELSAEFEKSNRLAEASRSAIAMANERAESDKARAMDAATNAKIVAAKERDAGSLVSEAEKKSIGMTNMLTGAVAPPALVVIGKVMEKFRDMFPIIEQSGEALIEMGTAIPAVMLTATGQLSAKLLYGLASLRDAIWTPNVRKRYDKSDAAYVEKYGKSRADFFAEAQEARVEAEKKRATTIVSESSGGRLLASRAKTGPVMANAPKGYTRIDTPDTRGTTGNASTAADARRQARAEEMREYRPNSAYTPPLGVVPVSASNRSIDEWR